MLNWILLAQNKYKQGFRVFIRLDCHRFVKRSHSKFAPNVDVNFFLKSSRLDSFLLLVKKNFSAFIRIIFFLNLFICIQLFSIPVLLISVRQICMSYLWLKPKPVRLFFGVKVDQVLELISYSIIHNVWITIERSDFMKTVFGEIWCFLHVCYWIMLWRSFLHIKSRIGLYGTCTLIEFQCLFTNCLCCYSRGDWLKNYWTSHVLKFGL